MTKELKNRSADSQVVCPGVIPHQQGNWQPLFVSNNQRTCSIGSFPGGVGIDVGLLVMVGWMEGVAVCVLVNVGSRVGVAEGVNVAGIGIAVGGTDLTTTVLTAETTSRVGVGGGVGAVQLMSTKNRVKRVVFIVEGSLKWFISQSTGEWGINQFSFHRYQSYSWNDKVTTI